MKVLELVFGLGVITVTLLSGEAGVSLWIKAYSSSNGPLNSFGSMLHCPLLLGTRVLMICHVKGLAEGTEVTRYRWFRNCTGGANGRCQVHDGDPYYRVVKDILLVDFISWDQGGKYNCFVDFNNKPQSHSLLSNINLTGNPAPFLYTPPSLLFEHSVITDVQQATGRNGQQWITCRSGREGTRPEIWMGSELVPSSSTANSATIGLGTQHPNGLYHCLSAQSQREYFSLFLRNSVSLVAPNVSAGNTSMWTLTSPDGSQVERYIVEFECRVRNITFVEKYMSVNTSGGTGQVATNVSCFGGPGQLYRVKVWAVSGANISPALVCMQDGQCQEEGSSKTVEGEGATPTPNEPLDANAGEESSIELAIGLSLLFLFALYTLVIIIVVVVAVGVKRKAGCKQKRNTTMRDRAYYTTGDEDGPGIDDLNPHMAADREVYINIRRPAPNVSSSLASASNIPAGYETLEIGYTINNDPYRCSMQKMGMTSNNSDGMIVNEHVMEEQYDDMVELSARYSSSEVYQDSKEV